MRPLFLIVGSVLVGVFIGSAFDSDDGEESRKAPPQHRAPQQQHASGYQVGPGGYGIRPAQPSAPGYAAQPSYSGGSTQSYASPGQAAPQGYGQQGNYGGGFASQPSGYVAPRQRPWGQTPPASYERQPAQQAQPVQQPPQNWGGGFTGNQYGAQQQQQQYGAAQYPPQQQPRQVYYPPQNQQQWSGGYRQWGYGGYQARAPQQQQWAPSQPSYAPPQANQYDYPQAGYTPERSGYQNQGAAADPGNPWSRIGAPPSQRYAPGPRGSYQGGSNAAWTLADNARPTYPRGVFGRSVDEDLYPPLEGNGRKAWPTQQTQPQRRHQPQMRAHGGYPAPWTASTPYPANAYYGGGYAAPTTVW